MKDIENNATKKSVLFLFDVDGTITEARKKISLEMQEFMSGLKGRVAIGVVGGSPEQHIFEQLGGSNEVFELYDYVFAENGLTGYMCGKPLPVQSITNQIGEEKLQEVINFCLNYMSKIKLPKKRGNFIEFRNGMLNVSPIGRSCSQAERDEFVEFERTHPIRVEFVKALEEKFSDYGLKFSIGGQLSVDIFPVGWDKTYCLRYLLQYEVIHFFGDKTTEGGNDYEIFASEKTIGHSVKNPDETRKGVIELLKKLGL